MSSAEHCRSDPKQCRPDYCACQCAICVAGYHAASRAVSSQQSTDVDLRPAAQQPAAPSPGHVFASGGPIPTTADTRPGFWKPFKDALSRPGAFLQLSDQQSTDVDQRPAAQQPAAQQPAASKPRDRDRARLALAEATDRIAAIERELSDANVRVEALQSDVAARQIRETDLAARLLKNERSLRESERIIQRQADELRRKRGEQ